MLSEPNRIDIIAKSPEGEIILAISAHEDWGKKPHTIEQLEKKLQSYIRFIENGQYEESYGNAPVIIQIMTAYALSPEAEKVCQKVENATGIEIKVLVMGLFGMP